MSDLATKPAIGLIVPSTNTTVEREITRLPGGSVDWFVTRVLQVETGDPEAKARTVLAMQEELGAATARLAGIGPAAIGFACTAASFLNGVQSDRELCAEHSARLGIPFITASTAIRQAMQALGSSAMCLVTPYLESVNAREIDYFSAAGITTVASSALGIVGNLPKGRLPSSASMEAARAIPRDGADVMLISCTNWLTLENLGPLSAELGIPVVSSNSALAWALLRAAGVRGRIDGLGSLADLEVSRA